MAILKTKKKKNAKVETARDVDASAKASVTRSNLGVTSLPAWFGTNSPHEKAMRKIMTLFYNAVSASPDPIKAASPNLVEYLTELNETNVAPQRRMKSSWDGNRWRDYPFLEAELVDQEFGLLRGTSLETLESFRPRRKCVKNMYYLLDRVVMNEHRLMDYHMNFQELIKYVLKRKPDIMTRLAVAEARFGQFCIDQRVGFILDDGDDCRHYLVWNLKPKQAGLDGVPYEYTLHSDSGPTGSEPHHRLIEFYNTHGGDNDYNPGFIFSLLMQLPGMVFGAGEHQKDLGEAVRKEGIISLISELVDLYTEFTQAVVAQKEQESADASEVLLRETCVPEPASGNGPQGKNKNTAKQRRQCREAKQLAAAQMQEMVSDGVVSPTNSELAVCAIDVEPLQETISGKESSASTVPETAHLESITDDLAVASAEVSSAFTAMAPAVDAPNTNAVAPTPDAIAALPALHVNPGLSTTLPWTMKNTFLFEGNPREEWYMYDRHTLSRRGRSKSGDLLNFMLLDPGGPMYVTPMMAMPGVTVWA